MIKVQDHVQQCFSANDGEKIAMLIKAEFAKGNKVVLSFTGIDDATSSFVNTAFIGLLNLYTPSFVKENLKIIDSTPNINELILKRFRFSEQNKNAI